MRTYEVLFILSPQLTEEETTTLINDFRTIAENNGATVKSEDAWGRRRLAYPIRKFTDGIYHLFVLESEQSLSELDRRMKNVDRVLRHVIVRTDLEQKRAEKLAKRNPKKERVRPAMPAQAGSVTAPSGAPADTGEATETATTGAEETAPQA